MPSGTGRVNAVGASLLVAFFPAGLVAAGYGFVAGLRDVSPTERLAIAMLAGLGAVLWSVSIVNVALPLVGLWAWVCFLLLLVPVARSSVLRQLRADIVALAGRRHVAGLLLGAVGVLIVLLWPLLSRPDVVFYDGTSGHDAFFWIIGAEHLQRFSYLQPAITHPAYPLFYSIDAISGFTPPWGRIGAEGLLALIAGLTGCSPLQLYVPVSAALFFPWVAAVYLVVRTFFVARCTFAAGLALVTLQPIYVFTAANGNLPNLLGAMAGGTGIVSLARLLTAEGERRVWLLLLAMSSHALMCAYPEMIPGIALTGLLLVVREGRRALRDRRASKVPAVLAALLLGLLLNPITTLRAGSGLFRTITEVAATASAGSIFDTVPAAAMLPAMATLSVSLGRELGSVGGIAGSLVVAVAAGYALRRARDRFGAVALFAGAAAILSYTLATGYDYGWQKVVQFSGVFLAALFPAAIVGAAGDVTPVRSPVRWLLVPATLAIAGAAMVANLVIVHRYSREKALTRDWYALRDLSRGPWRNLPVLIDGATFARPFFYSMWAAYFLDESRVHFGSAPQSGGYLRQPVDRSPIAVTEQPRAKVMAAPKSGATLPGAAWSGQTAVALRIDPKRP